MNEHNEEKDIIDGEPEIISPDEVLEPEKSESQAYEEILDKYARLMAEFDNFRKRSAKDGAKMFEEGIRMAITEILPSIDNLERAMASAEPGTQVLAGVEMTHKSLMAALQKLGVSPIEVIGKTFDPNLHNAVAHEENPDFGENTVSMELQKGYMLKDRVLRHSMVRVAN